MDNKLFCVLEQGKGINDPITIEHIRQFNTECSDFYRLNWFTENDPNAFFHKKDITWSEGRSLLYEMAPKNYEYYIFIDDDIRFRTPSGKTEVADEIQLFLQTCSPISGTFYSQNWHNSKIKNSFENNPRKFFPYMGQDLEVQIFSKTYAQLIMPVIFHGCWGSLWYANYICHNLYPRKQVCFSGVRVTNENATPELKPNQHYNIEELTNSFNSLLHSKDFPLSDKDYKDRVKNTNLRLYETGEVDHTPLKFSLKDLEKLLDIKNPYYVNRSAIIQK